MLFVNILCDEVVDFFLTFNIIKSSCTISFGIVNTLLEEVALTGIGCTSDVKA
jgi:hypothetical protein